MVEAFGLEPVILPDISGALDGTVPAQLDSDHLWRNSDRRHPHARRGAPDDRDRRAHARAGRAAAELTGVDYALFRQISGLKAVDRLVRVARRTFRPAGPGVDQPAARQLQDALLDGHFHFGGKRIAIAAEPDLLYALATFFIGLGAEFTPP